MMRSPLSCPATSTGASANRSVQEPVPPLLTTMCVVLVMTTNTTRPPEFCSWKSPPVPAQRGLPTMTPELTLMMKTPSPHPASATARATRRPT